MEFSKPDFGPRVPIDAYGNGGFRSAGDFVLGAQLFLASGRLAISPNTLVDLSLSDLAPVFEIKDDIDFLLIGCGEQILPLPKALRDELERLVLPVDLMDTGAACRTYNVLIAEERAFAALVFPIN